MQEPRPVMSQRLTRIVEAGVPVGAVLDVGVQGGTDFLIELFPDRPHLLFEPIENYFGAIRKRYQHVTHQLVHAALSDVDGQAWQLGVSRDNQGGVTHSFLSERPMTVADEPLLVECKPVRKARLDTALAGHALPRPYLLKVDVDGLEIPILQGVGARFEDISIVIVEASVATVLPKLQLLAEKGFQLLDIVDPCYYHDILSQVDLIFVSNQWVARCDDLRPWQTKAFAWTAWKKFR